MINYAIADSDDEAKRLKDQVKALLNALVEASADDVPPEQAAMPRTDGEPQPFQLSRCKACGRPLYAYIPQEPAPVSAHYCPQCWELDLFDGNGKRFAHASRVFEKSIRSLPPGSQVTSIVISGKTIEIDPPWVVPEEP